MVSKPDKFEPRKVRVCLHYKDGRKLIDHITPAYDANYVEYLPWEIDYEGHRFREDIHSKSKKHIDFVEVDIEPEDPRTAS